MERLTIEYLGDYVPKGLCTIDRYGEADDCELCQEYCKRISDAERAPDCAECVINQCFEKLGEYEGLEEQGKLLKLPCAVGDTVYHICTVKKGESEIIEMKVGCLEPCGAIMQHKGVYKIWNVYAETDYTKGYFKFFDFGKTVFLTREEAESEGRKGR